MKRALIRFLLSVMYSRKDRLESELDNCVAIIEFLEDKLAEKKHKGAGNE